MGTHVNTSSHGPQNDRTRLVCNEHQCYESVNDSTNTSIMHSIIISHISETNIITTLRHGVWHLAVHHIITLVRKGPRTPEWNVTLRKTHLKSLRLEILRQMKSYYT